MQIITKITHLQHVLEAFKKQKKTIGFVPTMGALHNGHISLIEASKKECDVTVCSIFVNPTQFNDKKDLERYPKTPEKDSLLLKNADCDVLFMPEVAEMYPEPDTRTFDFGTIDKILDGMFRPGHFNGVAQIVSKLFYAVEPHKAFFGSKDFQQVLVVKNLVKQLNLPIEIIACPILRENDGLAMSSRNMLLTSEERIAAKIIPEIMLGVTKQKNNGLSVSEIIKNTNLLLSKNSLYKLDYFVLANAITFEEITDWNQATNYVALIACFVGKIRLIDNVEF